MRLDLSSIDKVLFIVHLAIGDYTYMQRCFYKIKSVYPHLRIDLLIQDNRRTSDRSKWPILNNYILYEWLESETLFGKIYKTYSPELLESATQQAKTEEYPLVISLGDLRSQNYSLLAREIAQDKIAVGIDIETTIFHRAHKKALKQLDIRISDLTDKSKHISQKFAHWFTQIANVEFQQKDLFPVINIPQKWQLEMDKSILCWKENHPNAPTVFINIYAKGEERCWLPTQAIDLIQALQNNDYYKSALFILNTPPEASQELTNLISENSLKNTVTFCANNSFFELPALLLRCDLVITVDTSIMHLACISDTYLISLIRKKTKKDVRWTPLKAKDSVLIYTPKSNDSMSAISVSEVLSHIPHFSKNRYH